jgi:hypothetical protein
MQDLRFAVRALRATPVITAVAILSLALITERSLQVTYRKGKPFSAYLHLSHQTGEKSARTVPSGDGLLVVDYSQNGKAIGVEITAPSAVPLERVNRVLADLGETPLSEHDYLPVRAA